MPRRKQQAPKRAAGYVQEDDLKDEEDIKEEEDDDDESNSTAHLQGSNDPGTDEEHETGPDPRGNLSYQNSPGSHISNQDAENESLLSDASDQVADIKSLCSREASDAKGNIHPKHPTEAHSCMDKMTAVYANILSDSYWTGLGLGLKLSSSDKRSCDNRNGASKSDFDWHQDALTKSLQQSLPVRPLSKPNLFSSVQLYRQSSKMCGTVFTGASRFRCRQCSAAYDTLVELTVHMNESGHYQDDNHKKDKHRSTSYSKPRKRAFQDMDKEDAQKVLKCMFCGDSFDSLQDLSVHMIKTKHYQKVPLKEPVPTISSKMVTPNKKRVFDINRPCSPDSTTGSFADTFSSHKNANLQLSSNNRYGYQNGASYTWQFEACKSQILKCMECGSSHDTLQQLTTHMMVTGHFLKVTSSASKKGKQLVLDPLAVEKMQSLSDASATDSQHSKPSSNSSTDSTAPASELKTESKQNKSEEANKDEKGVKNEEYEDALQKPLDPTMKYQYLREEDLEDASKGGGDILKSLENTVTTAINKAQNGAPSWSAYPSIHAAYQLSEGTKPSLPVGSQVLQVRPTVSNKLRPIAPKWKVMPIVPMTANIVQCSQLKKEGDPKKEMHKDYIKDGNKTDMVPPYQNEGDSPPQAEMCVEPKKSELSPLKEEHKTKEEEEKIKTKDSVTSSLSNGCPTGNHTSELPGLNPLSALQSVLNNHLGKANEPLRPQSNSSPSSSSTSLFHKPNLNIIEKPVLSPASTPAKPANVTSRRYVFENNDQPIDLTKSKNKKGESVQAQSCTSPPQKHALSDIADMVKVLPKATTPKPAASSRIPSMKLEMDVRRFEDVSTEVSTLHKRKGRQSNWNPQHLLILQAQFASSLFQTSEGKYLLSDLGPQERMQISKFTGLSMTTISHWLANVKYQLRKTGGTKFLKNMDKGHPIFYCSDCASQFRTPSTYIGHLESHLGFQMKDMNKLAVEQQTKVEQDISRISVQRSPETIAGEEDTDSKFKCKLCSRTFVSKHAVKLHLSKTHSKSPEHHSQFVAEVDEE
ncbi:teashirt homolog 2 [Pantherophis guttatus]|uniref:Teashirt homolog 2 n=1 Tax=Pantherophis guttatus TaxID=94885 RepID=A0A6P9D046_PANGU|nr:teashirt homolog 2 [Pantherophis guttatus]XP_060545599.1 teashirt homolog 2 [Pantherophis guttatus]